MGPKKAAPAVDYTEPLLDLPAESSDSDHPVEENPKTKADAAVSRKAAANPSTLIMVKEALKALDSRKGVSYVAIQNYVKQKYPSVDSIRVKGLIRKALKKGIEAGTFIHPASANTGTTGRFRLAPKLKEKMVKGENVDPNVQKAQKSAKDEGKNGAKKRPKADARKPKHGQSPKSHKDSKSPEKDKVGKVTTAKVAHAEKNTKNGAEEESKDISDTTKTKAKKTDKEAKAKKMTKETKPRKVTTDETAAEAPASKATLKRGKKSDMKL